MEKMQSIRAVTANYFLWQGLRTAAIGPILIVSGLSLLQPSWYPFDSEDALPLLATLILGCIGFLAAGRYYEKTFGSVRGLPGQHTRRDVIKWFIVYPVMFLATYLDAKFAPKLGISGIVWAAATLAFWWSTGRGRLHYIPAAILLALTSFLPLFGVIPPGAESVGMVMTVVGAVYIVNGVLDHLELMRILPPVREDEHATAI
jgi:hypothetical protein